MPLTFAFVIGLVFGGGLCLSGMSSPAKVLGFLDLAGSWDPSLALVMGGAVGVGLVFFRLARARLGPPGTRIDLPLVAGAAIFGIGWGLVGFCPGPAVVALGFGEPKAYAFVAAMLAGMALHRVLAARIRTAVGSGDDCTSQPYNGSASFSPVRLHASRDAPSALPGSR